MAVRFDAASDRLLRTASLLSFNSAYTIMGWLRFHVMGDPGQIFSLNNNYNDCYDGAILSCPTLGVLTCYDSLTSEYCSGSNLSIDTWYHIAMVRYSATSLKVYLNGVEDSAVTLDITGRLSNTRLECGGNYTRNEQPLSNAAGRLAGLKAWSVAMTQTEIQQEMTALRPMAYTSLYGFWPCFPGSGERTRDYSGNGYNWTAGGTLTDEDPPPIAWGAPTTIITRSTSGASQTITTPQAIAQLAAQIATPKTGRTLTAPQAITSLMAMTPTPSTGRTLTTDQAIAQLVAQIATPSTGSTLTASQAIAQLMAQIAAPSTGSTLTASQAIAILSALDPALSLAVQLASQAAAAELAAPRSVTNISHVIEPHAASLSLQALVKRVNVTLTAPPQFGGLLIALQTSGQIGKEWIFDRRGFVRGYFVPRNPRSAAQQNGRQRFRAVQNVIKVVPAYIVADLKNKTEPPGRWTANILSAAFGPDLTNWNALSAEYDALPEETRDQCESQATSLGITEASTPGATDPPISPGRALYIVGTAINTITGEQEWTLPPS